VGDFVHESVKVDGSIGHLQCNLLHYTFDSLSEHLKSTDRYTTLAAQELVARRQKIDWVDLALDPCWTFLRTYFIRAGFLDGVERTDHRLHGLFLQLPEERQGAEHVMEVAVLALLLGLLIGSFLNVCIHRLRATCPWCARAPSAPECGKTIAWYDNIPRRQLPTAPRPLPSLPAPASVAIPGGERSQGPVLRDGPDFGAGLPELKVVPL